MSNLQPNKLDEAAKLLTYIREVLGSNLKEDFS
jgi:hypothetical protein